MTRSMKTSVSSKSSAHSPGAGFLLIKASYNLSYVFVPFRSRTRIGWICWRIAATPSSLASEYNR
ncbi:hypothetical protein SISSUDRAFT_1056431 [Sistotremastrum suecicum HHB10207 ss-3]|uniref:Uncharacterized protein n=1 Tax=Sistotremastrum suecicum HHB10207 ss-3 TaxID=1314776 RepID=A0A165WV89_9AGAM|nr:hypothetical protein SISSUDRAFT_1056431 [Sistotremastrum suecicum HHB10207 ss-3]